MTITLNHLKDMTKNIQWGIDYCKLFERGWVRELKGLSVDTPVVWEGWKTTLGELIDRGWLLKRKEAYSDWRKPAVTFDKLYLRHPPTRMMGRLTLSHDFSIYELDFLTPEWNQRITPPKVLIEADLTEDDIPALYDLILSLQAGRKRRRRAGSITQESEVLALRKVG